MEGHVSDIQTVHNCQADLNRRAAAQARCPLWFMGHVCESCQSSTTLRLEQFHLWTSMASSCCLQLFVLSCSPLHLTHFSRLPLISQGEQVRALGHWHCWCLVPGDFSDLLWVPAAASRPFHSQYLCTLGRKCHPEEELSETG
jgi:hypothetical protein